MYLVGYVYFMVEVDKRIPAFFFCLDSGAEPVRAWLKGLDREDRRAIGEDIKTVEFGWPVGMLICRSITSHKGLWEVRSALSNKRIARVLFSISGGRMVLLHGFIKKTQRTPKSALDQAARRMKKI